MEGKAIKILKFFQAWLLGIIFVCAWLCLLVLTLLPFILVGIGFIGSVTGAILALLVLSLLVGISCDWADELWSKFS
ncbi:hypothetical protein J2S08_000251 [Bacillus chungangensis]|uniref:Uncharacterized protein n=1 Tax=Bacillus chungangensis TaxID=587633 RepID=A0ABT9WNR2_9BACI|nr:hypothetical protein [Bacillus chungangensis]